MELPWPLSAREVVVSAIAFDDIDENGEIGININSLETGDENGLIPAPEEGTSRLDFDGGFLISSCPDDHICLGHDEGSSGDEVGTKKILVVFTACVYLDLKLIPKSFLNFLVKTAFGIAWNILLKIAEDVRMGKRPDHSKAISDNPTMYKWIDSRVDAMLSMLKTESTTGN